MRKLQTLLFILFLSITWVHAQPKYEVRAVWLTTLGGLDWPKAKANSAAGIAAQKKELCDILDKLQEAHFNTVLLQTRLRGDVIYPSEVETFTESLTGHAGKNPGYDPLAFAIEECHKRRMELHAWVVTIPVGNSRQVRVLGKQSVVQRQKNLCKQFHGSWYLDPGLPGTTDYLTRMVREIVTRYDVDGIHMDYIRYPEQGAGFPDKDTFKKYGNGMNLADWRRNNITNIVRAVYQQVKAVKPWVKVSSSPVGKYADTDRYSSKGWNARDEVYQDAQGWLREGIHDVLFPMMYFKDDHFYPFALDWQENRYGRWVVPGLGIYFLSPREKNWPLSDIKRQLVFIRDCNLEGQAYFRNKFLLDNTKELYDVLKSRYYTADALIPPMTWMHTPAPAAPQQGNVQLVDTDCVGLSWQSVNESVRYNLYASDVYPVDIADGSNLLATYLTETTYQHNAEKGRHLAAYYAVTAIDRYGNESEPLALVKPESTGLDKLNKQQVLRLPKVEGAEKVVLYTSMNAYWGELDYAETIDIKSLPSGFYFVTVKGKSVDEKRVGVIVK